MLTLRSNEGTSGPERISFKVANSPLVINYVDKPNIRFYSSPTQRSSFFIFIGTLQVYPWNINKSLTNKLMGRFEATMKKKKRYQARVINIIESINKLLVLSSVVMVDCKAAVFLRLVEMRGLVKRKVWSEGGNVE